MYNFLIREMSNETILSIPNIVWSCKLLSNRVQNHDYIKG